MLQMWKKHFFTTCLIWRLIARLLSRMNPKFYTESKKSTFELWLTAYEKAIADLDDLQPKTMHWVCRSLASSYWFEDKTNLFHRSMLSNSTK